MSVSPPPGSSSSAPATAATTAASPAAGTPEGATATTTKTNTPPAAAGAGDAVDYAIVEAAGQQFWLQPNRYVDLDRLEAEVDSTLTLNTVLLVKAGERITLGQPYIQGASVELKVLAHRRGPKILVYKMRRKKKTRRKTGHRQDLTRVLVQAIQAGS